MSTKGIIFSAPMVLALLAGTKTQTRRFIQPTQKDPAPGHVLVCVGPRFGGTGYWFIPPYDTGDQLYVREAYYQFGHWEPVHGRSTKGGRQKWVFVGTPSMVMFDPPADFLSSRSRPFPGAPRWYKRLGRFLPRSLSRLWLEVTEVRVQRLQDISEEDARAEGIEHLPEGSPIMGKPFGFRVNEYSTYCGDTAGEAYQVLWNTLHTEPGQRWDDNPWIVAVSFRVHHGNVDEVAQ